MVMFTEFDALIPFTVPNHDFQCLINTDVLFVSGIRLTQVSGKTNKAKIILYD